MPLEPPTGCARRTLLRAGLAALASGTAAGGAVAQSSDKFAQAALHYQSGPRNGAMCRICINFEAPNACKIVAGPIDPDGWCVAYVARAG